MAKDSVHSPSCITRLIALLMALNLVLVFFDLTYLQVRSLYLQLIPAVVQHYDRVKGIYPHPETQRYESQVVMLTDQVAQTGVESPAVAVTLAELRSLSQQLIQHNPFIEANHAILETIQQNLQARTAAESPFVAFDRFWSQDYLMQTGWQSEIDFWNQQIQPLINANYFRRVNRYGRTVDHFWLLDLPFLLIFVIDVAIRDIQIRRRNPQLSRLESLLRRWYDLLLLLPFWQWLRLMPTSVRLNQVRLLNLKPLQAEVRRDFALGFAKEMTEVVGVQAIDQMQAAIARGDVLRWLLYPELRREYVQINEENEIRAIVSRMTGIAVHQVLPQIQTEVEQLIQYSLRHIVLERLPGYRQFNLIPGIGRLPGQTADKVTQTLSEAAYQTLADFLQNPEVSQLITQLVQNFRSSLRTELQKKQNTQEIEKLLVDLLEEIKINYIKGISEMGIEQAVNQAEQLTRQKNL